ncbi:hypothetical protein FHR32_003581 [Streptosporangium album]|uniref:Uncharacterized protein n=1 Tax=Streptosporangium album TaxID=47479 RepID=A0A7W7RW20_9ACTN|nr:hypothetical protein [Streptosporangium album]MBB4939276.1 hypothetical protein [Streptosporangium album]
MKRQTFGRTNFDLLRIRVCVTVDPRCNEEEDGLSQPEPQMPAEETAPIPPRRRVARPKLVATVAAVLVAVAAGSAYVVTSQPAQIAASTPAAGTPALKVDGVEVHYLPDGLSQPEAVPATAAVTSPAFSGHRSK